MKSYSIKYLALAACIIAFSFSGCTQSDDLSKEESAFLGNTVYGIYKSGGTSVVCNESTHQAAFSTTENSVRLQKDDMSQYFHLKLDGQISKGSKLSVQITSKNMQITGTSGEMSVLKTDSDKAWLWDSKDKTGYLVPLIK